MQLRISDSEKRFVLGERVELTFVELYDCIWTLFSLSADLRQAVADYGKKCRSEG